MRLYLSLTSPYARKVRVMLLEKNLSFEAVNVADAKERALDYNPLDKVPTLVLDDGTALFDSRVITEALDALYPEPALIPSAPRERMLVRRFEALADGISDVLVPVVLESRRPAELRNTPHLEKLEGKARAALSVLEEMVEGRAFLHGEAFSLADIAVVSAIGYVNLRRPELFAGYPELESYVARQLTRPSLAETVPPNLPIRG